MSHTSGTATDVNDLAAKLQTWLTGLSGAWSVDRSDTQGTGKRLQVHKGTVYASFRFANNENPASAMSAAGYAVLASAHTGYSAALDWYNQTSCPTMINGTTFGYVGAPCLAAAIPYFFFSDGTDDNIVIAVQRAGGVWNYIAFGLSLEKIGSWTGGRFLTGSQGPGSIMSTTKTNPNPGMVIPPCLPSSYDNDSNGPRGCRTFARVDADSHGEEWRSLCPNSWSNNERTTRQLGVGIHAGQGQDLNTGFFDHLYVRTRSQLAQAPVVSPCLIFVLLDSGKIAPMGSVPLLRVAFTRSVLNEGDSFTIGSATYRAFGNYAVQEI